MLVILSHLSRHVIRICIHSCDYDVYFCGSRIGSGIVPSPHSVGFCGFCLGCVWLNIDHNFFKHCRLIIFIWPGIVSSVIGIVMLWFHFVYCTVCPIIVFFTWFILPVIGVFTHIIFIGITVITIHSCDGSQSMQGIRYFPHFFANMVGKYQSAVFLLLCCDMIHTLDNKPHHWDIINLI